MNGKNLKLIDVSDENYSFLKNLEPEESFTHKLAGVDITEVAQQSVTETTKSWRAKQETHGIPHRSGNHGSRRN